MVAGESGCGEFRAAGAGRVVRRLTRLTAIAATMALAACTQTVMVQPADDVGAPPPSRPVRTGAAPTYTVQPGDTLYKISVQYGVDYRDLANWNNIGAPYTIYPKQTLKVGPDSVASTDVASASPAQVSPTRDVRAPAGSERVGSTVAPATAAVPTPTKPAEGYNAELGVTLPAGAEPIGAAATPAPSASSAPVFEPVATASGPSPAGTTSSVEALPEAAPPKPDTVVALRPDAVNASTNTSAAAPPTVATPPAAGSVADVAATKPSAAGWIWPTTGKVVVTYANGDPMRQGIDIAGEAGQPVRAARDGEVVYSGAGLIGYGELVIIKHSSELLSAYGHNRVRLVKEGDRIKAGQKIAEMGKNAANRVLLHFEVRKNGKPVDPLPLLPAR